MKDPSNIMGVACAAAFFLVAVTFGLGTLTPGASLRSFAHGMAIGLEILAGISVTIAGVVWWNIP